MLRIIRLHPMGMNNSTISPFSLSIECRLILSIAETFPNNLLYFSFVCTDFFRNQLIHKRQIVACLFAYFEFSSMKNMRKCLTNDRHDRLNNVTVLNDKYEKNILYIHFFDCSG